MKTIKTSHTPGPWTVERDGFTLTMREQVVATAIAPDGADVAEQRANARLIAAVLEMREILMLALRYLEHPDVKAIPFAMSSAIPALRDRALLARIADDHDAVCGPGCDCETAVR